MTTDDDVIRAVRTIRFSSKRLRNQRRAAAVHGLAKAERMPALMRFVDARLRNGLSVTSHSNNHVLLRLPVLTSLLAVSAPLLAPLLTTCAPLLTPFLAACASFLTPFLAV